MSYQAPDVMHSSAHFSLPELPHQASIPVDQDPIHPTIVVPIVPHLRLATVHAVDRRALGQAIAIAVAHVYAERTGAQPDPRVPRNTASVADRQHRRHVRHPAMPDDSATITIVPLPALAV